MVGISRPTRQGRPRFVVAAALAALLLSGACSGDDGDRASATTTAPSETTAATERPTSTTVADDDAAVTAAYEAASRAFINAAAIPDPDFPALAVTHTGPMLEQRRETLAALARDGRIIRYPEPSQYRIEVESVEVDGDVARLVVCVVDDGERVEKDTGEVIASGVGSVQWTAALRRIDGSWRLAERREEARWNGVAGCAVD